MDYKNIKPVADFDWSAIENKSETTNKEPFKWNFKLDVIEGTIVSITEREAVVNIGYKSDGIIPASELRYNPNYKAGDKIEVYVESQEDANGQLLLSHKKARILKSWKRVNQSYENQETITGHVKIRTKSGFIVTIFDNIDAFLPCSQIDVSVIPNNEALIDKIIDCKIIKVNHTSRNIIISHKAVFAEKHVKNSSSKNLLKEIWQKHTEVQEQILQKRSVPIPVDVYSAKIIGDKLILSVDEKNRTDKILAQIAEMFGLQEQDLIITDGYFYTDRETSFTIDIDAKHNLSETAELNHIKFRPNPIVDGIIKDINPLAYLNQYYKNSPWEMGNENKVIIRNKYLNQTGLSLWDKRLGLNLHRWSVIFYIKDPALFANVNIFSFPKLNTKECSMTFFPEEKDDIGFELARLKMLMNSKFGKDNITFETRFEYSYDIGIITKTIEDLIRSSFPSIQFESNFNTGTLYFFQEYTDHSKRNQIVRSLNDELKHLCLSYECSYEIFSVPSEKEKYYLKVDTDSLQESLCDAVKDLRGCDFSIGEIISIGKLFSVNYPQLSFDISSSNKEKLIQLVENHFFGEIIPDLTGDLEKIARLKKSFEAISSGIGIYNPNLSEYIFDATKAKPIDDIDYYINSQSDFYNDINTNLLNTRVNESQKQAIIKTLLAEDLAIIQGPPGTGKSTAIAEIMWQHIRKKPQERILLTSETNLAVDNAIARIVNTTHNLVKPIRIGGEEKLEMEGKQFNIDTLKAWVENGILSYSDELGETNEEDDINDAEIKQSIILENWLANIARRIDKSQMDEDVYLLWHNILQNPSKEIRQKVFNEYIHNCNVVGATCSSIGEKNTKNYPTSFFRTYCELFGKVESRTNKDGNSYSTYSGKIKFDTVIQDESSKATPAELSLPLIYGKKNIIIGDHRQLPPLLDKEEFMSSLSFLLNNVDDEKKTREIVRLQKFVQQHFREMEVSHFQRLFESIDESLKGVFNQQYRMHPAINEVIKQFYVEDGGLYCGLDPNVVESSNVSNPQSRFHGLDIEGLVSPETHVIWIDTKTPEMLVGTSRVNYGEVEAIRRLLTKLHQSESFRKYQSLWNNDEDKQIGMISFYGKQLKLLKKLRSDFRDIPIRISTVDRFQGMERNIIIVSMVRSNIIAADKNQQADYEQYPELGFAPQKELGFAQSPNRLNVALSRAKRLLVIVGNSSLFRSKKIYDNVYNCIVDSPNGRIIKAEEL